MVIVYAAAVLFFGYGLWVHDWRILLVSALLAVIWPLIRDDVGSAGRKRELDRPWDDDDDLSGSA